MWDQSLVYWAVLVAANVPVYLGAGRLLYRTWDQFWENLRFSFTPEVISYMRGEWDERFGAEFKLLTFVMGCALVVAVEHVGFVKLGLVGMS